MVNKPSFPVDRRVRRSGQPPIPYRQFSNGFNAARHKPALQDDDDWRTWPEVSIRVSGLPRHFDVDTYELYTFFSKKGSISRITIHEKFDARDGGDSATIAFCPPPRRAFWVDEFHTLTLSDGRSSKVKIQKLPRKVNTAQGPTSTQRYPEYMSVKASALDFGVRHQPRQMMVMRSLSRSLGNNVEFAVDLRRRELVVSFTMAMPDFDDEDGVSSAENSSMSSQDSDPGPSSQYKFTVPFQQIDEMWMRGSETSGLELLIPMSIPPRFFRKRTDIAATHQDGSKQWHLDSNAFYRQTDITRNRRLLKHAPFSLRKPAPVIDIGRWLMYRIKVDDDSVRTGQWKQIQQAMFDFNIGLSQSPPLDLIPYVETGFWKCIDHPQYGPMDNSSILRSLHASGSVFLPFEVQYQLEVCISQGLLHESNMDAGFVNRLASLSNREALRRLESLAYRGERLFDPSALFESNFPRSSTTMSTARRVPTHCVWQRSVTITPTSIYFSSPTVEVTNRIIRKHRELQDRFLRVRFSDEKQEGRIHAGDNDSHDPLFTRIKRCLNNGITVGDRHFEYLASGNSQFREHGAIFYAGTPTLSADQIRKGMGDFSNIRIVAKYASRVGLCFSTTYPINGTRANILPIDDVMHHGYNFTDGVGKISGFLARIIADELGFQGPRNDPPSVFQFRLAGCKGVLAVSQDVGPRDIHIRESQYKFHAPHEGLEIIRCGSFTSAQLNRQLINILTCNGVPDHVFLIKQQKQLQRLEKAMENENVALDLLQHRVDPNQATLTVASMILDGFMQSREPFTMSLLQLWRAWSVKSLKEKASLDVEEGAFVLGCVDETNTLRGHSVEDLDNTAHDEGLLPEIFLQISDLDNPGRYRIITGVCVLARNPSLHPGDIRVVKAVDVPSLHHHKNAVVFPLNGYRDLPSMCSGGDLDGDDFFIAWDKSLVPLAWNVPPMDYKGPVPLTLGRPVTVDDITSFFVNYMKNDSLGRIANAHIANADCEQDGAKSAKCLKLAHLHSVAVDYVKSGVPARMHRNLKPRQYPHFLENRNRRPEQIRKSNTVLGKLFDMVKYQDFNPLIDEPFDDRILTAFDLDAEILRRATSIKEEYDAAVRRIMAQHEISTEFEIWTTFVLRHAKQSNDYKFHEEMRRISDTLKERFTTACEEEAGGRDYDTVAPFVAAMYTVTAYQVSDEIFNFLQRNQDVPEPLRHMQPSEIPLMSFPWLFQKELGKIARGKRAANISQGIKALQGASRRRQHNVDEVAQPGQDDLLTSEGVTHRGDLLELFQNEPAVQQSPDEPSDQHTNAITLPPAASNPPRHLLDQKTTTELLCSLDFGKSSNMAPVGPSQFRPQDPQNKRQPTKRGPEKVMPSATHDFLDSNPKRSIENQRSIDNQVLQPPKNGLTRDIANPKSSCPEQEVEIEDIDDDGELDTNADRGQSALEDLEDLLTT